MLVMLVISCDFNFSTTFAESFFWHGIAVYASVPKHGCFCRLSRLSHGQPWGLWVGRWTRK
jgi:hypothetical protein